MKRVFYAVVFSFLCVIIAHPRIVLAATNTPTPSPAVTPLPLPTGISVTTGLENQTVTLSNESGSASTNGASITLPIAGAELVNGKDFNVPDISNVASIFKIASQYFLPYTVKQQTKNQEANLYISGQATRCVYTTVNGKTTVESSSQPYKTNIIPELSDLDQATRQIAPILTNYSLKKTDGQYDFTRDPLELKAPPPCDAADTVIGTTQTSMPVMTAQGFSFLSIFQLITNLLQGNTANIRTVLLSKQKTPYAESIHCLLSGCKKQSADVSDLKTDTEKTNVQNAGGMAQAYAAYSHDPTKGKLNGQEENAIGNTSTNTYTTDTAAMENSTKYIECSVWPASKRAAIGLTDADCQQPMPTPGTTCSTGSLPAFTVDATCKLKNNSFHLSDKLVNTIEAAATAYKVPASLMLGVMYGEGAFNSSKIFGTAAVDTYLDGCTPLPDCDPSGTVINNIVPYFKSNWTDVADAVKIIDPNRTVNACNLTDGIFALADTLHRFQFAPAFAGKQCFGLSLVSTSAGTAQSCSDWKDPNAESAIRFWEFGNGWNDTTKSCATNKGSCLMGGGLSAQCSTGGDTCERIDNRTGYTTSDTISHNGCVWNVYKNN